MSAAALLRVKKLKSVNILRAAVAHNHRIIQAELGAGGAIDPSRTYLNERLAGLPSPDEVQAQAQALMAAAGVVKVRKDAVRALEFVVSLAPGQCAEPRRFFDEALSWLAGRFGGDANVLAADIHNDEAAPHMHVLILPLMEGRMVGSDAIGGPGKLRALQEDFFDAVAKPYGFRARRVSLKGAAKSLASAAVLAEMKRGRDPSMASPVWPLLRQAIEANPILFAEALGLDATQFASTKKKLRSMTAIFISKGKGSQRREDENHRVREPRVRNDADSAAAVSEANPSTV